MSKTFSSIDDLYREMEADKHWTGADSGFRNRYPVRFVLFENFGDFGDFVEVCQDHDVYVQGIEKWMAAGQDDQLLTYSQLAEKFNAAFDEFKSCDGVVVLSDLPGGSPFKTAVECKYARPEQKIEVIAGTNLPMIVTAVTMLDMEDDPRSLADELIETGRDCIALFELEAATAESESEESDGI